MSRILRIKKYIPLLLAVLLLAAPAAAAAAQPLAVTANLLNVRSGPGTNHSILTQVQLHTVLSPLEEQDGWARVVLPDGSRGWVSLSFTTPFLPECYAEVAVAVLNARGGPGVNHGILTQLKQGTAAAVLKEQDGWFNVILPEGGQGWIAGWFTEATPLQGYVAVTAALLNLRSGAGTNFQLVDQLPRGESLAVLGRQGNWLRVARANGATGWVSDGFVAWNSSNNPAKSPLAGKTIVIDPGHGGPDPGAVGITGYREKVVNLAVALELAPMLRDAGATVLMTRWSDWGPSLWERVNFANTGGADLFVSIHANAHPQSWANGIETYYYAYGANSARSRLLAGHLQQQLVAALGLKDLGVKTAGFYVIANTRMPSALVELGFLSHYGDEAVLRQPQTHRRAAEALFRGLENYFK